MAEKKRHDEIQGEIIHVYDGIEEADNELPRWWLLTLFGSMVFAWAYWFYFHGFGVGNLPRQQYAIDFAAAASEGGEVTSDLIDALAGDPSAVSAGEGIYTAQCAVCHRADGGGDIGPNLTDDYWIHGGSGRAIYNTIYDGVLTAAMPAWGRTLGATSVQQVAAYLTTLRGTNVDGKEAEGERWVVGMGELEDAEGGADAEGSADTEGGADEAETTLNDIVDDAVEAADDVVEQADDNIEQAVEAVDEVANEAAYTVEEAGQAAAAAVEQALP